MSVYEAETFLNKAIDSILNQTFENFEFIIFDDNSKDTSRQIIESYVDDRINLITNRINRGLTKNLNSGIAIAQGKYIARMDADDVAVKNRLRVQFDFMQSNPEVDVCGSSLRIFGKKEEVWNVGTSHNALKMNLLFGNPFGHPTAFAKSEVLRKNLYDETLKYGQDYELWTRLVILGYRLGAIDHVLLNYRLHENQVSSGDTKSMQQSVFDDSQEKYWKDMTGLEPYSFTGYIKMLVRVMPIPIDQFIRTSNILIFKRQELKKSSFMSALFGYFVRLIKYFRW